MANIDLFSEPPPLAADRDLDPVARGELGVDDRRSVVAGVGALEGGICDDGGAQRVVRIAVGASHAFVDHRLEIAVRLPAHVHADLDEDHDDSGVLAQGPVALGAEARIGENLCDGVARRWAFLQFIRPAHRLDEIRCVIVGDVLQGIGDAADHVVFAYHGHGVFLANVDLGRKSIKLRPSTGGESLH